jgi:hypothetical protein
MLDGVELGWLLGFKLGSLLGKELGWMYCQH